MNIVKRWLQNKPLIAYFILANLLSWLIWLPLVMNHSSGDATSGPLWWLHYLGGIGPAASAIIVIYFNGGNVKLKQLKNKIFGKEVISRWTLLGALLPLFLLIIIVLVIGLVNHRWINFSDITQTSKLPGLSLVGIMLFEIVFFGFGEEIGWRGFAWPRLRKNYSFIVSCALLTIPWAFWHLPLFFYNDNMIQLGIGGTIGWIASLFTGSIILGWLVDNNKSNIMPAILFHGMLDVVFISKAVAGKYDSYLGATIVIFSIIILLVQSKLAGALKLWKR